MLLPALIGLGIGLAREFVGGLHSLILTFICGMLGGWVGGCIGELFGWFPGSADLRNDVSLIWNQ
jgi:hypothetical protein